MARRPNLKELQQRIGYQFRDVHLLHEALTHASAVYGKDGVADYERLEFLGDRVLGLAVAEHLFRTFPDAPEGDLARRFNELVRKGTCAAVAMDLDLGSFINMGDSESLAGGRRKGTILADVCEAVLGAVYLDGGWEPVKKIITDHWSSRSQQAIQVPVDAKTALQEWVQARGTMKLPKYHLIESSGPDHSPSFTYEVRVDGYAPEKGMGRSRRAAEQAAAQALLIREGIWTTQDE